MYSQYYNHKDIENKLIDRGANKSMVAFDGTSWYKNVRSAFTYILGSRCATYQFSKSTFMF